MDIAVGKRRPVVQDESRRLLSFAALLNAADKRETVQFYVELPNGRTSTSILSLSGWKMNEITAPASEVIQITVQGKQNSNTWGTVTPKV